jgi:uncharacterized membrane protein YgaE (UPF0421/DUF939 family)
MKNQFLYIIAKTLDVINLILRYVIMALGAVILGVMVAFLMLLLFLNFALEEANEWAERKFGIKTQMSKNSKPEE